MTIGPLLCKKADKVIAKYSLRNALRPISIAEYKVLPEKYKEQLKLNFYISEVEEVLSSFVFTKSSSTSEI